MIFSARVVFLLAAFIALLLVSSGGAYALGGGGSSGDGRTDLLQGSAAPGGRDPAGTAGQGAETEGGVTPSGSSIMTVVVVPEPATFLLVAVGFVAAAAMRRRTGA